MRIWTQTLLPPVINQTLYFVIFGTFIGSQVQSIQGISYMSFIIPGLVMMAVINSSFSNVVSSFFGSKFQRNIEELMVSPTPDWIILSGYTVGGMIRGIMVGLIVFIISLLFTTPQIHNIFVVTFFIVLTALVFSLAGFLNAIFARKFDDVSIFTTFILTPLMYLGGVFYSIKNLPTFWQNISKLNPVIYMIDGFRYGFYGINDISLWSSAGVLIAFLFILASLNLYLFKKGVGIRS